MRDKIFIVDKSDSRNVYVKRLLESEGYIVLDYGENTYDFMGTTVYVFSPSKVVDLTAAGMVKTGSTVFAFKLAESVPEEFIMRNIKYVNMLDDEIFAHKNALLTAEGALAICINETEKSLAASKILVMGYGRVGKACCKILSGAGASTVPVVTTKTEEILASVYLNRYLTLDNYADSIAAFDIIINTIPLKILQREILKKTSCSALLLDLASNPGGIDFEAARELNLKTIHALGLPAKAAPLDAGRYLMERILRAL